MTEDRVQRRLAAILAADMVGYSRLMEGDETGTISRQKAHRSELIDPEIAGHGGRIVKTTGDGMLVEFPSVIAATECAVAIQRALAEREADIGEDRRIQYRMGINLGDIVIDGDDILGDGVNVAARLEGLSKPGGVCISDMVRQSVVGKLDLVFEDLGQQQVKNITKPVHAYQIIFEPVPDAPKTQRSAQADKPSIAVLPFDNMSDVPEQEFFSDGLSEDIITALSKIGKLRVIARQSTFAYKGQARDLRRIAGELGVRYVLEGSVRRGGDRLRITAQLIDAADGSHVWADRYDRSVEDLFDVQDEITKEVVIALRVQLTDGEVARFLARGTNNIEAWEYGVRAIDRLMGFTPTDYLEARDLAKRAIELDPNYALGWATLGFSYWWDGRLGYTGDAQPKFEQAAEHAERAMALDDSLSWAIGLRALSAQTLGRTQDGIDIAERGLELNPSNADVRCFLAYAVMYAGRFDEAKEHFRAAISLNPFQPVWYLNGLHRALVFIGEFEESLEIADKIINVQPANILSRLLRAFVYEQSDRLSDAREVISEVRQLAPRVRVQDMPSVLMISDKAAMQRLMDSVRKSGLPN